MDNQENIIDSGGKLIVKVTTARGAIPIADALVHISSAENKDGHIISTVYSDANGNTPAVFLSAPPKNLSMSPQSPSASKPYALYNLQVEVDGFYPQSYTNVQIYYSITSIQGVDLIPLSENENTDSKRYDPFVLFNVPPSNL